MYRLIVCEKPVDIYVKEPKQFYIVLISFYKLFQTFMYVSVKAGEKQACN